MYPILKIQSSHQGILIYFLILETCRIIIEYLCEEIILPKYY